MAKPTMEPTPFLLVPDALPSKLTTPGNGQLHQRMTDKRNEKRGSERSDSFADALVDSCPKRAHNAPVHSPNTSPSRRAS
jgi:hypothetical protein